MFRQLLRNSVLRRILAALGTLLGVAIFVFLMLRAIPGDQISSGLGTEAAALTPSQRAALEAYYGLDQPLFVQFFSWLGNIFTGNLGFSSRAQTSVLELTAAALPVTFELAIFSIVIALAIGIPLGMLSASKPDSVRDGVGQVVGLAGLSIPAFLLGTALLAVLASSFGFNPNGQAYATLFEDPLLNLQQMLLPSIVLGFGIAAPIMRTTRTAVLEIRANDFIRTAR
ncbi:MAG: glutathione transporter permease, partial [Microbacterium sp.]|uniref:ABC transporter permease n=1 Tax=Microbacterium sp. TaxID=51671 RepID=UPI002631E8B0